MPIAWLPPTLVTGFVLAMAFTTTATAKTCDDCIQGEGVTSLAVRSSGLVAPASAFQVLRLRNGF